MTRTKYTDRHTWFYFYRPNSVRNYFMPVYAVSISCISVYIIYRQYNISQKIISLLEKQNEISYQLLISLLNINNTLRINNITRP